MATFTYLAGSRLYQPWQATFDASSIGRQAMIAGRYVWWGQLSDGNSFWLTEYNGRIVSMTINDGIDDIVTATMDLPAAQLVAMLGNAAYDNADWVAALMSEADTVNGTTGADRLFGGGANDMLLGGGGADMLNGGAGDDTLDGGTGEDTATWESSAAAVVVDLQNGVATGEGRDTLISIERATGSAFDDRLMGSAGANLLNGGGGNDTLEGGLGNDTLSGGLGFDTVAFSRARAGVSVDLGLGTSSGDGSLDTLRGIENVTGSAYADLVVGSTLGNLLAGRGGNDTLLGMAGNDTLSGGLGDDSLDGGAGVNTASYAGAQYGVNVDLGLGTATGEGADTLVSIQNVIGSNQADILTGSLAANQLDGGAGDDTLSGGDGADLLRGGFGNDQLDGGAGIDTASYDNAEEGVNASLATGLATGQGDDVLIGIENLTGSDFDDLLSGNGQANAINGGDGDDTIDGAGGRDKLTGGFGADTFVFSAAADSTLAQRDTITDFSQASGDRIDLSAIDADAGQAGDQSFHLGGAAFTHSAGELIQYVSAGATILAGDTNGDGIADFAIQLTGAPVLSAADLVL